MEYFFCVLNWPFVIADSKKWLLDKVLPSDKIREKKNKRHNFLLIIGLKNEMIMRKDDEEKQRYLYIYINVVTASAQTRKKSIYEIQMNIFLSK